MTNSKLIATYARVSTARQEEEQTIQTQILTLKDFAQKNGYTIVKGYTDEGWSGDMLARPALDRLRQDAKQKLWQAVLIYDPDRLARRYSYQELVMDELREAGIEVMFVTVPAPKNSEDKILYGVRGIFAEYERVKITERFRLGKVRKAREGHIMVGRPLYGYDYILRKENVQGYYQINESEARVVKMIFAWVANEGFTIRKVAKRLQELGIKTKRCKRSVWHPSTVGNILRHTSYYGEWHYGKRQSAVPKKPIKVETYKRVKKSSAVIRPRSEWITMQIPAIIDKELFDRVALQLEANYALSKRNKKYSYLLTGKIWCICGIRRGGEAVQKGRYQYYRCLNSLYNYPLPKTCFELPISTKSIDDFIWQKIVCLMSSPELMQDEINKWLGKQENKNQTSDLDVIDIEKEIAKLMEHEDRYNKAYGAGVFSIEKLKEYTLSVNEKIMSLKAQLANNHQEIKTINIPTKEDMELFAKEANKVLVEASFGLKRAITIKVIDKIVGTKKELKIYGYLPLIESCFFSPNDNNDLNKTRQNTAGLSTHSKYDLDKTQQDTSELSPHGIYDTDTIRYDKAVINKGSIPFQFTIKFKNRRVLAIDTTE